MTIKIEFPSDRKDLALAFGQALTQIGGGVTATQVELQADEMHVYTAPGESTIEKVEEVMTKYKEKLDEVKSSHEQLAEDGASLVQQDESTFWRNTSNGSYGKLKPSQVEKMMSEDDNVIIIDEYNALVEKSKGDVPPPPVDDSEVDSNGLPWDERIHSANKSKNSDGSWRNARKPKSFDGDWKSYTAEIEAELKVTDDVPPQAVDEVEPQAGDVFGQQADDIPPPPVDDATDDVPPPPVDEANYPEKTFGELMTLITSNQKNDSVNLINEVLTEMGIEKQQGGNSALPVLKSNHSDRISEAYAILEAKL